MVLLSRMLHFSDFADFFAFLFLLIAFAASPLLVQNLGDLLVSQGFPVAE